MSTIVTRIGKGTALTWVEGDANFTNLNTDKYQSGDSPTFAAVTATGNVSIANGRLDGLIGGAYSNVIGLGVTPTSWSNTLTSAWAIQLGDKAAVYQYSGVTYLGYNVKINSSYAEVAITASGTPALLAVGAGDIALKTATTNPGADSTITFTTVATAKGATSNLELNCGQLVFPAAQNASSNVNTLDDYEEGTWTPTDASGAGLSFSSASGWYTKIGKTVYIFGSVTYPVTANGSSAMIGSLPFTAGASGQGAVGRGYSTETTFGGGLVQNNAVTIALYNTTTAITNATLSGDDVRFSGSYLASS